MFIKQLYLKNFRCFPEKTVSFTSNIVVIEGPNGIGKTTLLEALHYACYLRSFRTYTPRDMLQFDQQHFLVKIIFEHTELDQATQSSLQVSFFDKKRLVKLNDKALSSYKELMDHYRIITLTEDDLGLVKLGPDVRRQFIDQAILLYNPTYLSHIKEYKIIVDNRNKLLQNMQISKDLYEIWTEQLWQKTVMLQSERIAFIKSLQEEVTALLALHVPDVEIIFTYVPKKKSAQTFQEFITQQPTLFEQEKRFGRSLFGAHLDDVEISFRGTASRTFASRGQQKLIILLIKIAQVKALNRLKGASILLLDDFITDFDAAYARTVLQMLTELDSQLIFTIPMKSSVFTEMLLEKGAQRIEISI